MKRFIALSVTALMLASAAIHAEDAAPAAGAQAPDINQIKADVTKDIDERIQILTEAKGCISSASDAAALKQCRQTMRDKMKSDREENKASRKERRAERRARKSN